MMRMREGMLLAGLLLAVAAPAWAQMQSMPVYFAPKGGIGITLDGDFGREASTKIADVAAANNPTAIGGRAYVGLPFITVGLGASVYDPKIVGISSATQFMGRAALKVFGGPLVPIAVSLQVGAGYLSQGTGTTASKLVSVPIGLGAALN